MEKDEASDPVRVARLRSQRIMLQPGDFPDLVEQLGLAERSGTEYDSLHAVFYPVLPRPGKK